jgi:hypothetical protein
MAPASAWQFLSSAKGPVRPTKRGGTTLAPVSVLREFLSSVQTFFSLFFKNPEAVAISTAWRFPMLYASASAPIVQGGSSYARHRDNSSAQWRSHTESTKSSLTLKVRTAEGDTVELSLNATSLKQLETGSAQTSQGTAQVNQASESDTLDFKVKIKGDLSDKEVSDIASLIQSLETGKPLDSSLSSLSSFSGSFSQSQSVRDSSVVLYA